MAVGSQTNKIRIENKYYVMLLCHRAHIREYGTRPESLLFRPWTFTYIGVVYIYIYLTKTASIWVSSVAVDLDDLTLASQYFGSNSQYRSEALFMGRPTGDNSGHRYREPTVEVFTVAQAVCSVHAEMK